MLTRHLKLKLYKAQETKILGWLNNLTGVYNFGIRKIKLNAKNKIYFSQFDFRNLLESHSKKLGIPSHVIQGTLVQAHDAWRRCFKKLTKEPKLKGVRNNLNSIPFPDPVRLTKSNRFLLPGLGEVRFFKQDIPEGKVKSGRLIRKASGWYLVITIDAIPAIKGLKDTNSQVGIDTGFKHLAVLSDGTKYENPRELRRGAKRLAQAQRGKHRKLASRLQERQANRRKDRNHKVSLDIVRNHKETYCTNDNLKGQAHKFGKSVTEAGISQLRTFISYKSSSCGRKFILVESRKTTMTCSTCGALTGPTGLSGLAVRHWVCSACGAQHDRDINAAMQVLNVGLGQSLVQTEDICLVKPESAEECQETAQSVGHYDTVYESRDHLPYETPKPASPGLNKKIRDMAKKAITQYRTTLARISR